MVDTNKNNVLIIINYVNNGKKYCVYHYSSNKFVSTYIYIPSLLFFFSLNTPDNFTCRGFLISKTPGFNKISRAYSMVEGSKIVH